MTIHEWTRHPDDPVDARWTLHRTALTRKRKPSPRQVANRLRAQRPRWIPVRERLPKPTLVNGFHASLGVIALINGRSVRPCFFCLHGGDDLYPDVPPVGEFHTDEGLFYRGVTHWMPLPRGRRS